MMTSPKRGIRLLSGLLGVAMFTASTVTAVGVATAGTAGAAAANKTPYLVGEAYWNSPLVTPQSRWPGVLAAMRTINASGGINGHPLKVDTCAATDANSGTACAAQFVKDGVIATVSDEDIIAEVPYTQAMNAAGIPQIDSFVSTPTGLNSPNVFLLDGGSAEVYATVPQYGKLKNYKTYNILYGISASANANAAIVNKAAAFYQQTQLGNIGIPLTAADYQTYVAQAAATKADYQAGIIGPFQTNLLLSSSQSLAQPLVISLSAGQFSTPLLQKYGSTGGTLEGSMLIGVLPPSSTVKQYPGLATIDKSINSYYKATKDPNAAPTASTAITELAWLDVYALAKITKPVTGTLTPASVMTALQNAKNVNLLGLIKWTPNAAGPTGFTRISNPNEFLITVKNGKEVLYKSKPVNAMTPFK
jgi:ABC-type branched-subunit amino acid transport system substrate-binding protein